MKFLQQLMEMAKGNTKRKKEAKNARKKKAEQPTMDDRNNPVAKFAQKSGAGFHDIDGSGKHATGRKQRKEGKKEIKQQMENE